MTLSEYLVKLLACCSPPLTQLISLISGSGVKPSPVQVFCLVLFQLMYWSHCHVIIWAPSASGIYWQQLPSCRLSMYKLMPWLQQHIFLGLLPWQQYKYLCLLASLAGLPMRYRTWGQVLNSSLSQYFSLISQQPSDCVADGIYLNTFIPPLQYVLKAFLNLFKKMFCFVHL